MNRPSGLDVLRLHGLETHVLERLNAAAIVVDLGGVILYANSAAEMMYGLPGAELVGKSAAQLTGVTVTEETARRIMVAIRDGGTWEGEFELTRPDGTVLTVRALDSALYDSAGRVAGVLSVVVDVSGHAALEHQLAEDSRVAETLFRIGQALVAELDLNKLVGEVVALGTELTSAEVGAFFWLVDDGGERSYRLFAVSGVEPDDVPGLPAPGDSPLFAAIVDGGGVIRIADASVQHRGHARVRSFLGVPVRSRDGEVIGAMYFGHRDPGVFTEADERLIAGIGAHAGIAIENARLYEAEHLARASAEDLAQRLSLLQSLTSALSSAVSIGDVVRIITRDAVPEIRAPRRGLWLLDPAGEELRLEPDSELGGLEDAFAAIPVDSPLPAAAAIRTGELIVVRSTSERDTRFPELTREGGDSESFAVIPLRVEDRPVGVLALGFVEAQDFADSDRRFLQAIGDQCAQALDRARLYESERRARAEAEGGRARAQRLAEVLQTSLLPPALPEIPGIDLAARYRPGLAGLEVGGDFYDVFDTGGDWAVVIGDVCGKGPDAAAMTALVRYSVRAAAMDLRQPAPILAKVNEGLMRDAANERFCTLAYGRLVVTAEGIRVTVCRAGHPAPLVLRSGGEVHPVGAPGTALGLFDQTRLVEEATVLGPGDAMVFYTDGVTEAGRGAHRFGEAALMDVLSACRSLEAGAIARRLEESVLAFAGPEPHDDIAIAVLHLAE